MEKLEMQWDESSYSLLVMAIRSPITRQKYFQRLRYFLDFLELNDGDFEHRCNIYGEKAKLDANWITNGIVKYLQIHRARVERKEITGATLRNYIKPIKLLCEQLDIPAPWKKILRGMPKGRRYANDRGPNLNEIKCLIQYPDRRIKPIIYVMATSGIRLGAWDYLRWSDISPFTQNGKVIGAKITVYSGEEDEYFSLYHARGMGITK